MIIPLLMETTSKTKLQGYGRMAYIFFGSLLVVPSIIFFWHFSHLINSWPIEKHNGSPINKLSMIHPWNHHSRVIVKILHLVLPVHNWHNGNNSIIILWPHLFHNPPFIVVVSIKKSICYFYQCYYGIIHLCLVCLCFLCMANFKNFC